MNETRENLGAVAVVVEATVFGIWLLIVGGIAYVLWHFTMKYW